MGAGALAGSARCGAGDFCGLTVGTGSDGPVGPCAVVRCGGIYGGALGRAYGRYAGVRVLLWGVGGSSVQTLAESKRSILRL